MTTLPVQKNGKRQYKNLAGKLQKYNYMIIKTPVVRTDKEIVYHFKDSHDSVVAERVSKEDGEIENKLCTNAKDAINFIHYAID